VIAYPTRYIRIHFIEGPSSPPPRGTDVAPVVAEGDLEMNVIFTKSHGMLLLGIWLILMGLVGYVPLIASLGILLNLLAIAAGVLILIGR
jgi:hypothetical protein